MTPDPYYATAGLSQSGMKDLEVSPLRYWYKYLSGAPWPEPTPEMQFGSALHCLVLEPAKFAERYACQIDETDFPGCLRTIDDCRQWIREHGESPRGTRKADVIAQALAIDSSVAILDIELASFAELSQGKVIFDKADWVRLHGAAEALLAEPRVKALLAAGEPEVPLFAQDPETSVPLKAKLDWLAPGTILDLKTFRQTRGQTIERSITNAIFYEKYYRQGYFYHRLYRLMNPKAPSPAVVFAFVESDPPHEVRLVRLKESMGGHPMLYWSRASVETRNLINLYDQCRTQFGSEPWRIEQDVRVLEDEDIPQLAW